MKKNLTVILYFLGMTMLVVLNATLLLSYQSVREEHQKQADLISNFDMAALQFERQSIGILIPWVKMVDLNGNLIDLKEKLFRRNTLLLVFSTQSCEPCLDADFPLWRELSSRSTKNGFQILGIANGLSPYHVADYLKNYNLNFLTLFDKGEYIWKTLGIPPGAVNAIFLVNKKGSVVMANVRMPGEVGHEGQLHFLNLVNSVITLNHNPSL